jgi:hypothetical protein
MASFVKACQRRSTPTTQVTDESPRLRLRLLIGAQQGPPVERRSLEVVAHMEALVDQMIAAVIDTAPRVRLQDLQTPWRCKPSTWPTIWPSKPSTSSTTAHPGALHCRAFEAYMATMDDLSRVVKGYLHLVYLGLHIYTESSWAQPKKTAEGLDAASAMSANSDYANAQQLWA